MSWTSYNIDNDIAFARKLEQVRAKVSDLRVPMRMIGLSFFKSRRAIFKLKGPGKYPKLGGLHPNRKDPKTGLTNRKRAENAKLRRTGSIYPLLQGDTRTLEKSITNPNDPNAIFVVTKGSGVFGTRVEYGLYHQSDRQRNKIPLRKFLFFGPESTKFGPGKTDQFTKRALRILDDHVAKAVSR